MDKRIVRTFIFLVLSGLVGSFSLTILAAELGRDPGPLTLYYINGLVIGVAAGLFASRARNPIAAAVMTFFLALVTAALAFYLIVVVATRGV